MDGARLFNAEVALSIPAARIVKGVDSVTFCLTKGLACPAGAIVAGTADFVAEARRCRQAVGGGMRQAGIFAAAGIVALEQMIDRLAEDHDNARLLARILTDANLPVSVEPVATNMVYVELGSEAIARNVMDEAKRAGVRLNPPKGGRVRMVTHYGVDRGDIEKAAAILIRALRSQSGGSSALPRTA
jgi:threonine aldolase